MPLRERQPVRTLANDSHQGPTDGLPIMGYEGTQLANDERGPQAISGSAAPDGGSAGRCVARLMDFELAP